MQKFPLLRAVPMKFSLLHIFKSSKIPGRGQVGGGGWKPDTFIKVKVETDKLRLSTSARTQDGWVNLDLTPEIPLDILDNDELAAVAMDDESEMASIS
jgi:hypothetical protein